jgi:Putative peptidoglycan binding domain
VDRPNEQWHVQVGLEKTGTALGFMNGGAPKLCGFPYWWYPDYYYGYSNSQATGRPPLYDYRYWAGMATAVQTELANRGYYHGSIDVAIGPGSREAIRAFQKANNLPVSGVIDPAC